jgi:hypothetical protein
MSLTKLIKLFYARESLVSDISSGYRKPFFTVYILDFLLKYIYSLDGYIEEFAAVRG